MRVYLSTSDRELIKQYRLAKVAYHTTPTHLTEIRYRTLAVMVADIIVDELADMGEEFDEVGS